MLLFMEIFKPKEPNNGKFQPKSDKFWPNNVSAIEINNSVHISTVLMQLNKIIIFQIIVFRNWYFYQNNCRGENIKAKFHFLFHTSQKILQNITKTFILALFFKNFILLSLSVKTCHTSCSNLRLENNKSEVKKRRVYFSPLWGHLNKHALVGVVRWFNRTRTSWIR